MMFEQSMPKIGIIGLGFVGNAIKESMQDSSKLVLVDIDPTKGINTYDDLKDCEGIFICVPSPQQSDGTCDTSILESVLERLKGFENVLISKSTAPPDVYERLNQEYPNLVHVPEFLTAANAVRDYATGKFAIIGGRVTAYLHEAKRLIEIGQTQLLNIRFCTIGEAALAKYAINTFLATKVVYMNELKQLADAAGIEYSHVRNLVGLDPRIGLSHLQVPGPDGSMGFGGACFPKDTAALLKFAESLNVNMNVLDAAVKKNTLLRLTEPK